MGQDEVPGLEAYQRPALSPVRGPPRKPELTEAQKTLARVLERLRSPPLSHGVARELKKQKAILEREIAEMEQI